ncbi:MAG: hypothetical protein WCG94_09235, partial [Methanothrix sp.]
TSQPPAAAQLQTNPLAPDILAAIWPYVSAKSTLTNAFRYTEQEMSWLTDALYEISKHHHVKISKQDIARLGLNVILWDYRLHGDASLLGEFAIKKKGLRGDGT